jgi:hypothetical protein
MTNKLTAVEIPKPEKKASSKRLTECVSVFYSRAVSENEVYPKLQPQPFLQTAFHMLL